MAIKYYLDEFIIAYSDLWAEDLEDVFPNGAELLTLRISGDSELHFLSHIEYETIDGKSEESFLGSPDLADVEIMESVDDEIEEIIEMLVKSFEDNEKEVELDSIQEEIIEIYRCCVDYIILKALDNLVKNFSDLKIKKSNDFSFGLYRHDDKSITCHTDNDEIIKSCIKNSSFEKEQVHQLSEILFEDKTNRDWLTSK